MLVDVNKRFLISPVCFSTSAALLSVSLEIGCKPHTTKSPVAEIQAFMNVATNFASEFFSLLNTKKRLSCVSAYIGCMKYERENFHIELLYFTLSKSETLEHATTGPKALRLYRSANQRCTVGLMTIRKWRQKEYTRGISYPSDPSSTSWRSQRVQFYSWAQYTVFPTEKGWFQHCVVDLKSYSDLLTVPILTKVIQAEMNMHFRVSSNSCG